MDYRDAAALLGGWNNILILTHKRPDGDTIGCGAALCALLRQAGKTAWVLPNLEATARLTPYLAGYEAPEDFVPERVVAVDIATARLVPESAKDWLERGIDLAIDHHGTHEDYARFNCVEADKAACGEIIFKLVEELGTLTPEVAAPLYLALSTDTGCFVYGNTTANTHRVAAALMEQDIPARQINKRHFRTKSMKRLQLEAALVADMELYEDGRVAVAALRLDDMAKIGATEYDAEDIAGVLGQLEGVLVAATVRETAEGMCKISLRTDAGYLNASAACALLGGGGHSEAAGCTAPGDAKAGKKAISDAILRILHG